MNDADIQQAAYDDAGNRFDRRLRQRGLTADQFDVLRAGGIVTVVRLNRDARVTGEPERYTVRVRSTDADDVGPCAFEYSIDGHAWYSTAKGARIAGASRTVRVVLSVEHDPPLLLGTWMPSTALDSDEGVVRYFDSGPDEEEHIAPEDSVVVVTVHVP